MELGATARFAGEDGKPKSVKITDAHISALLAHAGNRAIPIHETHEWFDAQGSKNADSVEMNARIGALKAFRRDEGGNLIADAYLRQGEKRDTILWGAEHNPEDTCFSVVFSYLKDDPDCIPQNFRAADIVPNGAATTALFSEDQTQSNPMDIQELLAALNDPAVKTALQSILKSHEGPAEAEAETEAATMESEADVTEADKKPEDDQKPALMRAAIRCERARKRQFAAEKTALLAEVKTTAKAEATALIGKGALVQSSAEPVEKDGYTAKLAEYRKNAPNDQVAAFRLLKDHPEHLDAHMEATAARVAKLSKVS